MSNVQMPGSMSPSSSPRLPSPPPFPEVQFGLQSPKPQSKLGDHADDARRSDIFDNNASRRIRPGTKAADMASGPPLVPLPELDSPFQLQEHLKALYHESTRPENDRLVPVTRDIARSLATPPGNVDRLLWLYELCRFLIQRINNLVVGLLTATPACTAEKCPEMRAADWQYLCAVHLQNPKSCSAIDYTCHTLDAAANALTSPKHFPSRLTLSDENQTSQRQVTTIFRRVYRIFAHAWFQHREVFWSVENQEGLYLFFKTVCDIYSLIPEDNYTIPPEAEGMSQGPNSSHGYGDTRFEASSKSSDASRLSPVTPQAATADEIGTTALSSGISRKHKHTPSTGSFVTTIAEGDEDAEEGSDFEPSTDTTAMLNTARRDPPRSPTKAKITFPPPDVIGAAPSPKGELMENNPAREDEMAESIPSNEQNGSSTIDADEGVEDTSEPLSDGAGTKTPDPLETPSEKVASQAEENADRD